VGRPREHDDRTAQALLLAAEEAVERSGTEELSLRGVATAAGTSTRAVYSLYGSRAGLVAALAAMGFHQLLEQVAQLPVTDRPVDDLVAAGLVIRRFALEHPAMFQLMFRNRTDPFLRSRGEVRASSALALDALTARVASAITHANAALDAREATLQFRALCDGLAGLELGGTFTGEGAQQVWESGLRALVRGLIAESGRLTYE
jgi:AcrR family transcriptional regulator